MGTTMMGMRRGTRIAAGCSPSLLLSAFLRRVYALKCKQTEAGGPESTLVILEADVEVALPLVETLDTNDMAAPKNRYRSIRKVRSRPRPRKERGEGARGGR